MTEVKNKYTDKLLERSEDKVLDLDLKGLDFMYEVPLYFQNLCSSLGSEYFIAKFDEVFSSICRMCDKSHIAIIIANNNMCECMNNYKIELHDISENNIKIQTKFEEFKKNTYEIESTISKLYENATGKKLSINDNFQLITEGEVELISSNLIDIINNKNSINEDTEAFINNHLYNYKRLNHFIDIWNAVFEKMTDNTLIGHDVYRVHTGDNIPYNIPLSFTINKNKVKNFYYQRDASKIIKTTIKDTKYYPIYKLGNIKGDFDHDLVREEEEIITSISKNDFEIIDIESLES